MERVERMALGPRIAEGRTAEVFAWDERDALKLFRDGWSTEAAAHEEAVARELCATGAPCPAVHGLAEVAGRYGVIYERVVGPSLEELFRAKPWLVSQVAYPLAETHAAIHTRSALQFPPLRERLARHIQKADAPAHLREAALRRLETLPDGESLCHGDYHPGNVLLSERGPLVIDWENATRGHPLADVARTELLLRMGHVYLERFLGRQAGRALLAALLARYLRRYRQLTGADFSLLASWRLPVVVARLSEGISREEPHLLALAMWLAAS